MDKEAQQDYREIGKKKLGWWHGDETVETDLSTQAMVTESWHKRKVEPRFVRECSHFQYDWSDRKSKMCAWWEELDIPSFPNASSA